MPTKTADIELPEVGGKTPVIEGKVMATHRGEPIATEPAKGSAIAAPSASSLLKVLADATTNPAVDVVKMRELFELQKEMRALQAEENFNYALREAQAELPRIVRDGQADRFKYAKLETIADKIGPIIHKHGFAQSFGSADSPLPDHYRVTCRLSHGAHTVNYFVDVPTDAAGLKGGANKTPTQAFGSTMSYGRRYLTILMFNVTIVDEDTDGKAPPEFISEAQVKTIRDLLKKTGGNEKQFCDFGKIESLEQLPAPQFESAVNMINKTAKLRAAAKAKK